MSIDPSELQEATHSYRRTATFARIYYDALTQQNLPEAVIAAILGGWAHPIQDNTATARANKEMADATVQLVQKMFPDDDED